MNRPSLRIVLDAEDFGKLTSGAVVKTEAVGTAREIEIVLADIGFDWMLSMVRNAIANTRKWPEQCEASCVHNLRPYETHYALCDTHDASDEPHSDSRTLPVLWSQSDIQNALIALIEQETEKGNEDTSD